MELAMVDRKELDPPLWSPGSALQCRDMAASLLLRWLLREGLQELVLEALVCGSATTHLTLHRDTCVFRLVSGFTAPVVNCDLQWPSLSRQVQPTQGSMWWILG